MTQTQTKKLTDEQAARMGEDSRRSLELAHKQLNEYQDALISELADINAMAFGLSPQDHAALIEEVREVTMEVVRIEPAMKESEQQTVSVIYGYPDTLHAFLSRADFKSPYNLTTEGGITLVEAAPITKA